MELRSLKVAFHHPSGLTEAGAGAGCDAVDAVERPWGGLFKRLR